MEESREINLQDIERIFRTHYTMLCKVALAMVRDKSTAEDIVQDVFLTIWKKKDELIIGSNLKGYLYRSVSNSCLNYLQSYHYRNIKPTELFSERALGSETPDSAFDYERLDHAVKQAIDRLPPRCKMIFILSRLEGLKHQQIAETLNLSAKTVENQMGIALSKLREDLKEFLTTKEKF